MSIVGSWPKWIPKIFLLWAETTCLAGFRHLWYSSFCGRRFPICLVWTKLKTSTHAICVAIWLRSDMGNDMATRPRERLSGVQVPLVQDECLGIVAWGLSTNSGPQQIDHRLDGDMINYAVKWQFTQWFTSSPLGYHIYSLSLQVGTICRPSVYKRQ